jgi:hypothetical protein
MASIKTRLERLEKKGRFLDWFAHTRLLHTMTPDELDAFAGDTDLTGPIPNRPSELDRWDRKSLIKLWEEDERIFGGRSGEELEYYADNGIWPEQNGGFHHSTQDGNLIVEWRIERREKDATSTS